MRIVNPSKNVIWFNREKISWAIIKKTDKKRWWEKLEIGVIWRDYYFDVVFILVQILVGVVLYV